jgi:AcrR family transcriptional regulator
MKQLVGRKGERRRQAILTAARKCFVRYGLHGTRTSQICKEARISPGGLFHHFDSKEDIVQAVALDSVQEVIRGVTALVEASTDPVAALLDVVAVTGIMQAAWGMTPGLRLEVIAEAERNKALRSVLSTQAMLLTELIERLIDEACAAGRLPLRFADGDFVRLVGVIWNGVSIIHLVDPDFDLVAYGKMVSTFLGNHPSETA